ncbi:MAG: FAD-dependent oxidoreductase [Thermoleophilia bacterium]|nr:FAD-dependent oxidoreductase [Thermoleophilia bacterium]
MSARPRVVVVGGGFAGLEAAFLVRMRLHDDVEMTLVSDRDTWVFKPNSIYIPFGAEPESLLVPLDAPLRKRTISFLESRVREVDPDRRRVSFEDGTSLPYDFLVLATGSGMRPGEIPGLGERGESIWTPEEMLSLRAALGRLREAAGRGEEQRALFLVPPNNKCAGPLYELAFMLETWLRRERVRDRVAITYSTFEQSFIQAFGPRLHQVVTSEFAERGVEGHTGEVVTGVGDGEVRYADGSSREFDLLVSFPPYISAVTYDGLPADERGFLQTELETRQVVGHPDVYAPGDAGDFPVKQAFLAFLQADAVAEHIAGRVQGRAARATFDPVSMCIMEMLDKATFAQVPLRLTGDPALPVEVRPGADDLYKVGVSPIWRLGKKILGAVVPMRFHAGEPFHAGTAWQLMDVGLRGMKGILAD